MRRRRTKATRRSLGEPPQPAKFTSQTRDALMAILQADTGMALAETLYEDGLALERLLDEIGGSRGRRRVAIAIIRELVRKATADGAEPGSIGAWSFFTRAAKIEMQRVQAA
jgi:hypothetical protein